MLQTVLYDPDGAAADIADFSFWEQLNDFSFAGTLSTEEIEKSVLDHNADVILAAVDLDIFSEMVYIQKLLTAYPDIYVVIIGKNDRYANVRQAFLMGAFDYLTYDKLEITLQSTLMRMTYNRRDVYFSAKIHNKLMILSRHIFDGGENVGELVRDIVYTIYSDWNENSIACQQVIEKLKLESYKTFVLKKPWLEKFIYRGDYIRDIGFELKSRDEIERELCRYYTEVSVLFKKYNVIDVNKTIYTIGKSVIRQVDEKVTLESVAGDVYLNKSYVSHIFKEMTGISFSDFVLDVKIDRAKTLLHYPEISVSEIADILCFSSSGYFSMLFKRHTGTTPTEYRRDLHN